MNELVPLTGPGTMVVFDIDNTTLRTTQTLGSRQFFKWMQSKAKARGLSDLDALLWTLDQVTPIQPCSPVLPVEQVTPQFIKDLQQQRIQVFALTDRPENWTLQTVHQLAAIGIDFAVTAPADAEIISGIHFQSPGREKGLELVELLRRLDHKPKRLVFIGDQADNVTSVENAMNTTTIQHLSLRYGAADKWVSEFDPEVAQVELEAFQKTGDLMSDEKARDLLKGGKSIFPAENRMQ